MAKSLSVEKMSLREFIPAAWSIIEPARVFSHNWHLDCISEHLEAVDAGQISRLIINIPPRFGKSSQVTVLWPSWSWTGSPWSRWIFCSYAATLSVKHSRDRRLIMESDWFKEKWGNRVRMAEDQNQKAEFQNTARGHMIATSVGGSTTGKGANKLVVDDLINPFDAESKSSRESAIDFFRHTLTTRLDDPKTSAIVVVEQRTHKADLSGTLMGDGGWVRLSLPVLAEARERIIFPMTGRVVDREAGDLLWPERHDVKSLEQQKVNMGTRAYAAQYQQSPTSEEGAILRRSWWKFFRELPKVKRSGWFWDTAVKEGERHDFSVGLHISECEDGFYISRQFKGRLEYPELRRAVRTQHDACKSDTVLIEDKSSGQQLIQDLRRETALPINSFEPAGKDKVWRANKVSPLVEAGKVFLPEGAAWVADFIETCAAFPDVEHDDQVDALTMGLIYFTVGGRPMITVSANNSFEDEDD